MRGTFSDLSVGCWKCYIGQNAHRMSHFLQRSHGLSFTNFQCQEVQQPTVGESFHHVRKSILRQHQVPSQRNQDALYFGNCSSKTMCFWDKRIRKKYATGWRQLCAACVLNILHAKDCMACHLKNYNANPTRTAEQKLRNACSYSDRSQPRSPDLHHWGLSGSSPVCCVPLNSGAVPSITQLIAIYWVYWWFWEYPGFGHTHK